MNETNYVSEINGYKIKDSEARNDISEINQKIEESFNYSLTEINTNQKWIDGKDIYRKVINTGDLTDTTRYDEYNTLYVDTLINGSITPIKMSCIGGDDSYWYNFDSRLLKPYSDLVWIDVVLILPSNNNSARISISYEGQAPLYEKNSYVILEYVKNITE